MILRVLKTKKALNKAFLKVKQILRSLGLNFPGGYKPSGRALFLH